MAAKRDAPDVDGGAEVAAKRPRVMACTVEEGGLTYMTGFNNEFATEALEGALPVAQNSPQKVRPVCWLPRLRRDRISG